MASLTKIQLVDKVLQHLAVLAAGQAASAEDAALVSDAVDAARSRLSKFGLVPFATSAIPEWAQDQLRDYVAGAVSTSFGRLEPKWRGEAREAEKDLQRQMAVRRKAMPTVVEYF